MKIDKIFIASDHAGFEAKAHAKACLGELGLEFEDLGTNNSQDSVDYPDFAAILCEKLRNAPNSYGILICGTGIGISIAANRYKFVRCALCHDISSARLAREHNNANILAFGGRTTGKTIMQDMIKAFFSTEFAGGRHEKRVEKLGQIDAC